MFVAVVSAGTLCAPTAARNSIDRPVPTWAGADAVIGSEVGASGWPEPQLIGMAVTERAAPYLERATARSLRVGEPAHVLVGAGQVVAYSIT